MSAARNVLVVFCAIACARAGWVRRLRDGDRLELAPGVGVRYQPDRPAVHLDLAGVGVAVARARAGFDVSVSMDTEDGARSDKHIAKVFFPLILGFKLATAVLATLITVTIITMKALTASKVALLLAGVVFAKKLFEKKYHEEHIEYVPHMYQSDEYPLHQEYFGHQGYSSPLTMDSEDHESSDANISTQYAASPAVSGNISMQMPLQTAGIKKRVFKRKKPLVPVFTIHKISHQ